MSVGAGATTAAELTGPPDQEGFYGRCNIDLLHVDGSQGHSFVMRGRCNMGESYTALAYYLNWAAGTYGSYSTSQASQVPVTGVQNAGPYACGSASVTYQQAFPGAKRVEFTQAMCGMGMVSHIDPAWPFVRTQGGQTMKTAAVTSSGAMPGWPGDWYPGGTASAAADAALGAPGCSRFLSQNNGENVGTFDAEPSTADSHVASYAWSWSWGDGSAASDGAVAQHVYPALGAMPGGGWTAAVTVTATAAEGHVFADGAATATATCALRVDFLNPDQSEPGSTSVDGADDDCPTGFGWLNPLAIVRVLRCVFVPDWEAIGGALGDLRATADSRQPFTWVTAVTGTIRDWLRSFTEEGYCGWMVPMYDEAIPGSGKGRIGCQDGDAVSKGAQWSRGFLTAVIWVGVGARIWKTAPWNKGVDSGLPGE